MTGWARRVRRPPGPRELDEFRDAAEALADESRRAPGQGRLAFQTISDAAILGTVLISGALAAVHLFRALYLRHREDHPGPNPMGAGREPPQQRGGRLTAAAGEERPGHSRS
jgi:hypothetical protein